MKCVVGLTTILIWILKMHLHVTFAGRYIQWFNTRKFPPQYCPCFVPRFHLRWHRFEICARDKISLYFPLISSSANIQIFLLLLLPWNEKLYRVSPLCVGVQRRRFFPSH